MAAATEAFLIGGRYRLGSLVSQLQTGAFLSALDRKTGNAVQIHRVDAPAEQEVVNIRTQARVVGQRLAGLRHRNLPRVYDLVEEGNSVYSIQEEFAGKPLASLQVPVSPEMARRYLEQLLSVLAYLHGLKPAIIHRDVRPETILVAPHGTLQLIGADLARVGSALVQSTVFRGEGSPEYASPELLLGEPSNPLQDLYSAGAVAYFLVTGKAPAEALKRVKSSAKLEPLPATIPANLSTLITRLLDVEPENRPAGAREALADLTAGENGTGNRLPLFLLEPAKPAPSAAAPAVLKATEVPKPEVQVPAAKRSMWDLLFSKSKVERTSWAPDEESSLIEDAVQSFDAVDLDQMDLDVEVARLLPETAARSIQGICIGLSGPNEMIVAAKDPSLVYIYDHVNYATQGQYRAVLRRADPDWIDRAMEWAYRSRTTTNWRTWVQRRALDKVSLVVANPMADVSMLGEEISHPIVEATDRVIKEALAVGTSDIHMEAFENRMEIRYRIDGVLQPAATYPPDQGTAMVKRIKVMANMDVSQERTTQGGRIALSVGEKKYDLRVSIVPVAYGESVVMRVLQKGSFNLTLSDLGLDPNTEKRFRAALRQPHGIILVCGPTGSGKSTTLYASLKELQRPDRKLLTVEDPVEYGMDGLVQVQVNLAPRDEEQKVTFAKVLREFLRQDPEVILVGEIRDPETASIALQAALTGHLVLSTLHTNDSIAIMSRLRDMAIKNYLVASTLRCGLSQRLARRICPACREEIEVAPEVRLLFEKEEISQPYRQFQGRGCRECLETGYRGRVGIYELLEVTPGVRSMIAREASDEEFLAQLKSEGFRSLYQNALEQVVTGQISFEEVQRVCEG